MEKGSLFDMGGRCRGCSDIVRGKPPLRTRLVLLQGYQLAYSRLA